MSLQSLSPDDLDAILEAKREQLDKVIQDTRDKERELKQADFNHRRSMAKEFKDTKKEYDDQLASANAELKIATDKLSTIQEDLLEKTRQYENLMKQGGTVQAELYELNTKVTNSQIDFLDLSDEINKLKNIREQLEQDKVLLNEQIEAATDDKNSAVKELSDELDDFRANTEAEKQTLTDDLRDLKLEATRIKNNIDTEKKEHTERAKELRQNELSFNLKVKAFREEKQKFQIEKRKYNRNNLDF